MTRAGDPLEQSVHQIGREGAWQLYFTDYTLTVQPGALFVLEVRREQVIRWNSRYIRSAVRALANFISPITL